MSKFLFVQENNIRFSRKFSKSAKIGFNRQLNIKYFKGENKFYKTIHLVGIACTGHFNELLSYQIESYRIIMRKRMIG